MITNAVHMMRVATGEAEETYVNEGQRKGGQKGGEARAEAISAERRERNRKESRRCAVGRILKAGKPAVITFRLDQRQRIVSQVGIATPISRDDVTGKVNVTAFGGTRFTAVWDTGAERTTVVPRVIENTQLKSHGFCKNRGVDGIVQTRPVYLASISMQTIGGVTFHSTEIVRLERDDQPRRCRCAYRHGHHLPR